jgi:hypothetical protein
MRSDRRGTDAGQGRGFSVAPECVEYHDGACRERLTVGGPHRRHAGKRVVPSTSSPDALSSPLGWLAVDGGQNPRINGDG